MVVKEVKEVKEKPSGKEFSFSDLNKSLSSVSYLGGVLKDSSFSSIDEWIHTGNYHLNACVSGSLFKGYPNNRSVAIQGQSGCGKTFFCLSAIKSAQDLGYFVIYYDTENAVDTETMENFGIDTSRVRYEPTNTVQEFRTNITVLTDNLIKKKREGLKIPKILIILDSAGNLATQKEIDDAISGSEKADMTRAKVIKSIFRIINTRLAECKIPLIFTNHTYQTQDFISQSVGSGGTGAVYSPSIILNITKAQLKDGDTKTGIIASVTPNKNRFAIPNPIKVHINFKHGMNEFVGLEKYVSWNLCGIQKGKILTEAEFLKLKENDRASIEPTKFKNPLDDKFYYFEAKETSRTIAIKHLCKSISAHDFYTKEVFTLDVLKIIDEFIKPIFTYSSDSDEEALHDLMTESDTTEDED